MYGYIYKWGNRPEETHHKRVDDTTTQPDYSTLSSKNILADANICSLNPTLASTFLFQLDYIKLYQFSRFFHSYPHINTTGYSTVCSYIALSPPPDQQKIFFRVYKLKMLKYTPRGVVHRQNARLGAER